MIPLSTGVRVWIAAGHTDMRRGMQSLALLVQEAFKRDPHAGDLYVFRGRSGSLIKILWHDGIGMSLYAKRRSFNISTCLLNAIYQKQSRPNNVTCGRRRSYLGL
jgi:transposase